MFELSAVVSGVVQGVGFRWTVMDYARAAGLTGWVRNEPDGTVRVLAQGTDSEIADFLNFLHDGPPLARVEKVASNLRKIDKSAIISFNIV